MVLSNRETHDKVPGSSSTIIDPLLEPGLDEGFDEVVNDMMRTDGRVNRISICGSGLLEASRPTGRLDERCGAGVAGLEAMRGSFDVDALLYCLVIMIERRLVRVGMFEGR